MYGNGKMKKEFTKKAVRIISAITTIILLILNSSDYVSADSFFEYYFVPGETEKGSSDPTDEYDDFIKELPEEIRENLPEEMLGGDPENIAEGAGRITNFTYLWNKIWEFFKDAFLPSIKSTSVIIGIIFLGKVFRTFSENLSFKETKALSSSVINAGIVITIISTDLISISVLEEFCDLITGLMNGMVPFLTVIYASSGNVSTAAIQGGGVMMLVTLCQNLFANILMPAVRICLVLSTVHSIFPDVGIKPITTAVRNTATGIMVFTVTLFSFILSLQNSIAQSADSFGAKSIKFFIGNLVPIIGGAVSDSLSTVGGSLSALKSAGGAAAIVIIIVLLLPTLITLLVHRFTIFMCKTIAGITGSEREESLLADLGSISSIMLAFAAAISITFIYALTLFTNSVLAISI